MCTRRRARTRDRAVQRGVDQLDLAPREPASGAIVTMPADASTERTYWGSAAATPRPRRWPIVNATAPSCRPSTRAVGVVDLARPQVDALAIEEAAQVAAAEEADVLALGRRRRGQPGARGLAAHVLLVGVGERELEHAEQLGRHACEHRRLVLGGIGAARDERTVAVRHEARVVAGREALGAEPASRLGEQGDAEVAVAGGAGVRRAPGLVVVEERLRRRSRGSRRAHRA